MSDTPAPVDAIPKPPRMRPVSWGDVRRALAGGLSDVVRAPLYALAFGVIITAAGIVGILATTSWDAAWLSITIGIIFPLVFPFLTAGLYEVSRRLAANAPLSPGLVWAAIWTQRDRQMGWMAFVVLFIFWIWIYQVRLLLALFLGTGASSDLGKLLLHIVTTSGGLSFLAIGTVVGLTLALILFTSTVMALPLLFERDLDFVTALIVSWQTVLGNKPAMLGLGVLLTAATLIAIAPAFIGFVLVVPLFGFTTWRLYDSTRIPEN